MLLGRPGPARESHKSPAPPRACTRIAFTMQRARGSFPHVKKDAINSMSYVQSVRMSLWLSGSAGRGCACILAGCSHNHGAMSRACDCHARTLRASMFVHLRTGQEGLLDLQALDWFGNADGVRVADTGPSKATTTRKADHEI